MELSIVLVIIGLLIGGIFVGQSLIHNAQINAVITEFNRYQTSVKSFQQQYQALPGDMTNATSFWGVAGGTGSDAACAAVVSTTTSTCNGNGDGTIWASSGSHEQLRFWQHLANAKMIEGSYSGLASAGGGDGITSSDVGKVVPASKYTSGAWSLDWGPWLPIPSQTSVIQTDYGSGHVLTFGAACGVAGNAATDCALVTPKDAWSIDKKIDDGKPGQGNVIAYPYQTCTTAAVFTDTAASYNLSYSSPACSLFIIAGF